MRFLALLLLVCASRANAQVASRTGWLPDNYPLPFIGNGYLSSPVFGEFMYVRDLYNGKGHSSFRVPIPSTVSVRIDKNPEVPGSTVTHTFNAEQGFFETLVNTDKYWIRQKLYSHIRIPELMIMEIEAQGKGQYTEATSIPIARSGYYQRNTLNTSQIHFNQDSTGSLGLVPNTIVNQATGNVVEPDLSSDKLQSSIGIVWDEVPESITLTNSSSRLNTLFVTAVDRNLSEALKKFKDAKAAFHSGVLFARHRDAWGARLGAGRISFEAKDNNPRARRLQQATFSSLYALLSVVPDHPDYLDRFIGLGPSTDDVNSDFWAGRIRWEQEVHIFPPLLLLHPRSANLMIQSRLKQLGEAVDNAKLSATSEFEYAGAKYPYGTITGSELWQQNGNLTDFSRALYTSGCTAFALQQYISSGYLDSWKGPGNQTIVDAAVEIAKFYQKIVTQSPPTKIEKKVVGVNVHLNLTSQTTKEMQYVFNHAFTNAAAAVALRLPKMLLDSGKFIDLDAEMFAELERLADTMYFPTAENTASQVWHPVAETSSGLPIMEEQSCEPDLLLAYFPLRHPFFTEQKCENLNQDLQKHQPKVGTCRGVKPTYGTTRHTIQLLAERRCDSSQLIGVPDMLDVLQGDFSIITDFEKVQDDSRLAVNLAGHGSLLQGILNGYGGLELLSDRLVIDPVIPEGTQSWTIDALDYQGYVLNLKFTETKTHIKIVTHGKNSLLFVEDVNGVTRTPVSREIFVKRAKVFVIVTPKPEYHWSEVPYLFESHVLPEQKYMPEVGNGHIATIVNGPYVHMNGLYNGEGPKSSRAKIPSLVAFQVRTNHTESQLVREDFVLNVREGTFKHVKVYDKPEFKVEREVYAHRDNDRLLVARVTLSRPKPENTSNVPEYAPVAVWINGLPDETLLKSTDITFDSTISEESTVGTIYNIATGRTIIPEVPGTNVSTVCLAWQSDVRNMTVKHDENEIISMTSYISIGIDALDALVTLTKATSMQNYSKFFAQHTERWAAYWDNGFIHVDPKENFELAQALYGSFYFLLASMPNKQDSRNRFIGLSPGGLARGPDNQDYSGHIFWDTESWMYPPILNFHPDQARLLLEARTETLEAAKANAAKYGFQGAKFAWESAFSGTETSPWPPSGEFEIHITGDVALAVLQYLYVTDDKVKAIREMKLDEMAIEMAKFWQSRTTCEVSGKCSILNVMPPDEYHYPINNSVYTNYVAKLALELPAYVLRFCGGSHPDLRLWAETARRLHFPRGVTKEGKEFHLEFDGFTPGVWHPSSNVNIPEIKQGDVILLGYPLDMNMSADIRRTDLEVYRPITDEKGPAMTWGMFAVGYLELGRLVEADELFEKNFENIVQPFGVWSEVGGGDGALNFLTGMGGFLQAVVNGYGGIRLREDHITINAHRLPQTSNWKLVSYRHLGYQFDISFDFFRDVMTFETVAKASNTHLVLSLESGKVYDLAQMGKNVTVRLEKAIIRPYDSARDGSLKPTAGSSDGSSVIQGSSLLLSFAVLSWLAIFY